MKWFMDKNVSTSKINLYLPALHMFSNSDQLCRALALTVCASALSNGYIPVDFNELAP